MKDEAVVNMFGESDTDDYEEDECNKYVELRNELDEVKEQIIVLNALLQESRNEVIQLASERD